MQKSETKIFFLFLVVIVHSIFILACLFFMISHSFFNYHNNYIDILALMTCLSFIVYKKCILVDIYYFIKNMGCFKEECLKVECCLPEHTKDNYLRNKIKNICGLIPDDIDYTHYRLDKLDNISPILKNKELSQIMFNHKMHYLLSNVIVTVMLINKYNYNKFLPVFILWILNIFKM